MSAATPGSAVAPLLAVRDLKVWFARRRSPFASPQWVRAVDGVDLAVVPGETFAVVGESGSGKTTLGRAITMLTQPTEGSVTFAGREISGLRGRALREGRRGLQMVFQDPFSSLDPRMEVGDLVGEPLRIRGVSGPERRRRVAELLDQVGLGAEAARRLPRQFSGGQRQRIGIARALAGDARLIVCDEPLSALDVSIQAQIVNLLLDLQKRLGLAYIFISHDLSVVRQMATRVAVMYLGRIVELAAADDLFAAPRHPYTVALMAAVPALPDEERQPMRTLLTGDPPSPVDLKPGCRFQARCWLSRALGDPAVCREVEPVAAPANDHVACHFRDETQRLAPAALASASAALELAAAAPA